MEIKNVPLGKVKAGPDDGLNEGEFLVYPSTFTKTPDSYGDVVAPGAFTDTIADWKASGNTLPGLYGHRMDDPDFFVAGALDMGEDDHGWWVKGAFDLDSPKGATVYRLVKGRRLNQLSFAYDVLDAARVKVDGEDVNELRKVKVHEFSFVPVGANQDTSVVAIKAIADGLKAGRTLSAKNETAIREAVTSLNSVLTSLDGEDGKAAPAATNAQEQQASGEPEANTDASAEEPSQANASVPVEEPKASPSVDALATQALNYALKSAERGSQ